VHPYLSVSRTLCDFVQLPPDNGKIWILGISVHTCNALGHHCFIEVRLAGNWYESRETRSQALYENPNTGAPEGAPGRKPNTSRVQHIDFLASSKNQHASATSAYTTTQQAMSSQINKVSLARKRCVCGTIWRDSAVDGGSGGHLMSQLVPFMEQL
jgi:hypothetical protein